MEDDAGPGGGAGPEQPHSSGSFEQFLKGLSKAERLLLSIAAVVVAAGAVWSAISHLVGRDETPVTTGTSITTPAEPTTTQPIRTTTSTAKTVSLTIQQPREGGAVRVLNDVRIRVNGAGVERLVWILVKFKNGDVVYPQGECDDKSDELTVCPEVQFGDKGQQVGAQFEITAVVVDLKGHQRYKSYRASGFPLENPPVTPLATSQTVTVHRV